MIDGGVDSDSDSDYDFDLSPAVSTKYGAMVAARVAVSNFCKKQKLVHIVRVSLGSFERLLPLVAAAVLKVMGNCAGSAN